MTSQPLNRPVDVNDWFTRVQFLMVSVLTFGGTKGLTINERPLMDELDDLVQSAVDIAPAVFALIEAAGRVLMHRVGDLPNLGYIRDNDQSRKDIAAFVAALAAVEGKA